MLTAAHIFCFRETSLLERLDPSLDAYLYALAPDSLPILSPIPAELTHNAVFSAEILSRYPKLCAVRHHIMLDNIGHYGTPGKPALPELGASRAGELYRTAARLQPFLDCYLAEHSIDRSHEDRLYLAHILAEIAFDYRISLDEPSVDGLMRRAMAEVTQQQYEEYASALSSLYGIARAEILDNVTAPLRFYGELVEPEMLYKYGRAKLILRKCGLQFSQPNIQRVAVMIERCCPELDSWRSFLTDAARTIRDAMADA